MLGIDEAGRGPVLGPMVYAAAFCPIDQIEALRSLGVADSKVLSEGKREEIYFSRFLQPSPAALGWDVRILSAEEISEKMLRFQKYNLNQISHDAAIELIERVLASGYRVEQIFVDTVGNPAKYEAQLREKFPAVRTIRVSAKADSIFPIVSAASIVAKVTRDSTLRSYEFRVPVSDPQEIGSGYPSDPKTVKWLQSNVHPFFGFPPLIRFSWSTCEQLLQEKAIPVYWRSLDEHQKVTLYPKGKSSLTLLKAKRRHVDRNSKTFARRNQLFL